MRRCSWARYVTLLAVLACGGAMGSAAFAQDERVRQVDARFDRVMSQIQAQVLRPRQSRHHGSLAQGASERLSFSVDTVPTLFIGFCDSDCTNLDSVLLDASGAVVASDVLPDDYPIVTARQPGTYTVEVRMTACSAALCSYGLQPFSR